MFHACSQFFLYIVIGNVSCAVSLPAVLANGKEHVLHMAGDGTGNIMLCVKLLNTTLAAARELGDTDSLEEFSKQAHTECSML